MVLPRWLGELNRSYTNRIFSRIPARISPFGIVHHRGRKTGHPYTVPLAAFRTPSGFLFTPTYGPDADWVRNVMAADSFQLDRKGRTHELHNTRLITRAEAWPLLPRFVRLAMRLLGVRWYVAADTAD
jgi:deazaflavin-dependent oxidoreductase (nitroreductase family)